MSIYVRLYVCVDMCVHRARYNCCDSWIIPTSYDTSTSSKAPIHCTSSSSTLRTARCTISSRSTLLLLLVLVLGLVRELEIDGRWLAGRYGKFPESLTAIYISQVLCGLAYLHDRNIIHRDIKVRSLICARRGSHSLARTHSASDQQGANILITKGGVCKLADFGVATKLEGGVKSLSAVGTPYWSTCRASCTTAIVAARMLISKWVFQ